MEEVMKDTEIRKLVKIVEESNIAELEISKWGKKIRIIKSYASNDRHPTIVHSVSQPIIKEPSASTISEPTEKPSIPELLSEESPAPSKEENCVEIRSPMVGTFYRAPSPEADPYVELNDHITPGKVLCIIEAMKLMNEIEAEISGTIVEILVDNGQPVEYNQPLFRVLPDKS